MGSSSVKRAGLLTLGGLGGAVVGYHAQKEGKQLEAANLSATLLVAEESRHTNQLLERSNNIAVAHAQYQIIHGEEMHRIGTLQTQYLQGIDQSLNEIQLSVDSLVDLSEEQIKISRAINGSLSQIVDLNRRQIDLLSSIDQSLKNVNEVRADEHLRTGLKFIGSAKFATAGNFNETIAKAQEQFAAAIALDPFNEQALTYRAFWLFALEPKSGEWKATFQNALNANRQELDAEDTRQAELAKLNLPLLIKMVVECCDWAGEWAFYRENFDEFSLESATGELLVDCQMMTLKAALFTDGLNAQTRDMIEKLVGDLSLRTVIHRLLIDERMSQTDAGLSLIAFLENLLRQAERAALALYEGVR